MDTNFFIDTHAHIDGEEFTDDLELVIERAKSTNIQKIFIPNINANTISRIEEICTSHQGTIYPMIGLHPEDVNTESPKTLDLMSERLERHNNFIAIGEIGLDYYWDTSYKEMQKEIFKRQIKWGAVHNLPLTIHTRSAHTDMIDIMKRSIEKYGDCIRGVFHCFAGNETEAEEMLGFENFMLGIGGIVTFKNSLLPQVLKSTIPLERIVLETDSPYMAPVPNRGKRNESAFIKDIAVKLADIYNCSIEHIMSQTTHNALSIFTKSTHNLD